MNKKTNMDKNKMIWDALEWANKVNGKQGVIDCATAMGIEHLRFCKGCIGGELHYEDQCVVCGTHNAGSDLREAQTLTKKLEIKY